MFENFDELMDETMEELQETEAMEQEEALENGEAEVAPEEKEAVGYYDSSLVSQAWGEYRRLPESEREKFLRSNSRNAHVMMVELGRMKRGEPVPGSKAETAESGEASETVGYSSSHYEHEMASALKSGNRIAYDHARSNWANAKVRESVGSTTGEGEAAASEDTEAVGYSSSHYEHEMATALKNGNRIAYDHARSNWANAKARESVGSTTGEGEAAEAAEDTEAVGYSSSHYEHEMATALKNGNKIAYDHARSNWANAKARESVGSTTGEGEVADEAKEAVGSSSPQYWLNKATKDLAEGHMTAYKINMDRYYGALVKESAGYKAEDGSIIEGPDPNERNGMGKRK